MPAIYAQAYQGDNGKRYVLITNKGSNAQPAEIVQDGAALTEPLLENLRHGQRSQRHELLAGTEPHSGAIANDQQSGDDS